MSTMSSITMSIDLISVNSSTTDGIFSDFQDEERSIELNRVLEEIDAWLYNETTTLPPDIPSEIKEECQLLKEKHLYLRIRGYSLPIPNISEEQRKIQASKFENQNMDWEESLCIEHFEEDWVDIHRRPISPYFFLPEVIPAPSLSLPVCPIVVPFDEEEAEGDLSYREDLVVHGTHLTSSWLHPTSITPSSIHPIQDWLVGFSKIRWKDIAQELYWLLNQRQNENCVWMCVEEKVSSSPEPDPTDSTSSYSIRLSTYCQSSLFFPFTAASSFLEDLPTSMFILACHSHYCYFYSSETEVSWEDVYFLLLSTPWTLAPWPPFSSFEEDLWIDSDSPEVDLSQLVNAIVKRISEDVFMDIYPILHPSPAPPLPPAPLTPTLSTLITVKPAPLHLKPCKPYKPRSRPFSSRPPLPTTVVIDSSPPPSSSTKPFLFHPHLPPLSAPHSARPYSSRRIANLTANAVELDVFERVTSARTGRKIPYLYHH